MIAMIGTSDRLCWLAESCKILLLLLSGYTYIRRIRSPQNMWGSLSEDSTQEVVGRSVAGR